MQNIQVRHFFDKETSTLTYLVLDTATRDAVVIDPVWNFDFSTGNLTTTSVQEVTAVIQSEGLQLKGILETHAHADHLSGAQVLKKIFPQAPIAISEKISDVQRLMGPMFGFASQDFVAAGFDHFLKDGETARFGSLTVEVLATPGHTPACTTFKIGNHLFVGDAMFMPDSGTGRCDFPGGSAEALYQSIKERIYKLDENLIVYTGHDYQPQGRELRFSCSLKDHKDQNIHIKSSTDKESYVEMRTTRDKTLSAPRLLLPSLQVNLVSGNLPFQDSSDRQFLKIPLKHK